MLLEFSVSNYRAFRDQQTLNFAASNYDKTLPENCIEAELAGLKRQRWIKGVAIYGPNAGGKSSVLNALQALSEMVRSSAKTTDPADPIKQIVPFALDATMTSVPTGFEVVFVSESVRYQYRVAATRERVWHESLRAFPKGKEQLWFCRQWNAASSQYDWSPESSASYRLDPQRETFTLPNVLFLSKAISLGDQQLEPIFRWFKERLRFLDLAANTRFRSSFTAKQIDEQSPLAPKIESLIRFADLGVHKIQVQTDKPDPEMLKKLNIFADLPAEVKENFDKLRIQTVSLTHYGANEAVSFPWELESAGTQRLFELAGPWLDILENGYTVCIDELENSMHPLMVIELLRMVFDPNVNKNGAQVVFTTHNPLVLDLTLLRRDQVWFAEKDRKGEAHLYPLTDYAPRQGESLVRGYLSGRYGAVPFIPHGLLGTRHAEGSRTVGASQ